MNNNTTKASRLTYEDAADGPGQGRANGIELTSDESSRPTTTMSLLPRAPARGVQANRLARPCQDVPAHAGSVPITTVADEDVDITYLQ